VGPGLLPPDILVLGAWRELWAWGCRRPCSFPGHGGSCGPCGSRVSMLVPGAWRELWAWGCPAAFWLPGHAGAVSPRHPPAMLIPGAWRELWARVCSHPCWFPGHGGSCGPGSAAGHVGSRDMAGAVGSGVTLARLVHGAWQEL